MIGTACFYILPVVGGQDVFLKDQELLKKDNRLFKKEQELF
jgi:hypothetical protein